MASSVDLTTFPTTRNDATESSYTKMADAYLADGVIWGVGNGCNIFADSSGMHCKVQSGRTAISGFIGDNTSQQTLDIATANATNPRIDRVVARLTIASPATIALKVITGTAAATPAAPALVDDGTSLDIPMAQVLVGAAVSTITAGNITSGRIFTGSTGWIAYTPVLTAASGSSFSVGSVTSVSARFEAVNMTCRYAVSMTAALSGSNPGSLLLTLPLTAKTQGTILGADVFNDARRSRTASAGGSGLIYADIFPLGSDTWATDGVVRTLYSSGSYEIAPQ